MLVQSNLGSFAQTSQQVLQKKSVGKFKSNSVSKIKTNQGLAKTSFAFNSQNSEKRISLSQFSQTNILKKVQVKNKTSQLLTKKPSAMTEMNKVRKMAQIKEKSIKERQKLKKNSSEAPGKQDVNQDQISINIISGIPGWPTLQNAAVTQASKSLKIILDQSKTDYEQDHERKSTVCEAIMSQENLPIEA